MRDEGLANWLADNGLGKNAESGKKTAFFECAGEVGGFFSKFEVKIFPAIVNECKAEKA